MGRLLGAVVYRQFLRRWFDADIWAISYVTVASAFIGRRLGLIILATLVKTRAWLGTSMSRRR